MNIDYYDHHCHKKVILIHNSMAFAAFYIIRKSFFYFFICKFNIFVIYWHQISIDFILYIFIISLGTFNKDIVERVRKSPYCFNNI